VDAAEWPKLDGKANNKSSAGASDFGGELARGPRPPLPALGPAACIATGWAEWPPCLAVPR